MPWSGSLALMATLAAMESMVLQEPPEKPEQTD
jgi:hypothetical protein